MINLPRLKMFDGLLKLIIPALLSTVTNARQDEQIKDISEILRGLKNEINKPIRRGNS